MVRQPNARPGTHTSTAVLEPKQPAEQSTMGPAKSPSTPPNDATAGLLRHPQDDWELARPLPMNPITRRALRAVIRVFCPIWKKPWMSVGGDTYASDLLRLCGGDNVFADRSDRRYPIVETSDIVAAEPEVVLLPDEPYEFGPRDAAELGQLAIPAARNHRIHPIDGTLVSWYGPRIARAIATVRRMLENE